MQEQLSLDGIPYGYCRCGCGEQTRIPTRHNRNAGQTKGVPLRYILGHNPTKASPVERFWATVDRNGSVIPGMDTPCWPRSGSAANGYTYLHDARGKNVPAHRFAYELLVGPIPAGLTIDHLCRFTRCVNPDHLEPVTHAENIRRAAAAQTYCKHGHLLSGDNLYRRPNGYRMCRTCARVNKRAWVARRNATS